MQVQTFYLERGPSYELAQHKYKTYVLTATVLFTTIQNQVMKDVSWEVDVLTDLVC